MSRGIYVEILIRAPMDALWTHTQTPALHERWDLRFSQIHYLPKSHDEEPQRFQYSTRLGFGVEVSGQGETVGQRDSPDGSRSSALKFWSAAPLSIIAQSISAPSVMISIACIRRFSADSASRAPTVSRRSEPA